MNIEQAKFDKVVMNFIRDNVVPMLSCIENGKSLSFGLGFTLPSYLAKMHGMLVDMGIESTDGLIDIDKVESAIVSAFEMQPDFAPEQLKEAIIFKADDGKQFVSALKQEAVK